MCLIGEYDTIITTGVAEEMESGDAGVEDFGIEEVEVGEEAGEFAEDG